MTDNHVDFSRFELMLLHRLDALETLTKEQHVTLEELRVDFAIHKTAINTRVAIVGAAFGGVITLVNALLHLIL